MTKRRGHLPSMVDAMNTQKHQELHDSNRGSHRSVGTDDEELAGQGLNLLRWWVFIGTGKGGQSIWGHPFADEIRPTLKVSIVKDFIPYSF